MTDEKLCLKWNDFQNIVQTSFAELRSDTDFTDVTLACEDQSIKAHKVILSACSPFFKKLLKTYPHPQPLIYMRGMKSTDLAAIVDFIYLGEANVFQDQLEGFLALAEELQLKGLDGREDENVSEYLKESSSHTERPKLNQKPNISENKISNVKYRGDDSFERTVMTYHQRTKTSSIIEPGTMARIESMIEKHADGYSCNNCGYTSKNPGHLREHVEKHIEGLEYPCNSCNKIMRSSHSFRDHIKRFCPISNKQKF